jgi:hypothetical protein
LDGCAIRIKSLGFSPRCNQPKVSGEGILL